MLASCSACSPLATEVEESPVGASGSSATTGSGAGTTTVDDTSPGTGDDTGSESTADPGTSADTTSSGSSGSTGAGACGGGCSSGVCLEERCVSVASCLELEELDTAETLPSGVYELDPDGDGALPAYEAYCELDYMGGGWTLVLKSMGESYTFEWASALWDNEETFQPQFPDLDRNEAKLASYMHVPLSEMLVGMEYPIGKDPDPVMMNWLPLAVSGASLHALISPGVFVPTTAGREAWKGLMMDSSLQLYCNREGLNNISGEQNYVAQRIGIIANEYNDCWYADSRLGVGGKSGQAEDSCSTAPFPTGNAVGCGGDNGDTDRPAFAAVFVR